MGMRPQGSDITGKAVRMHVGALRGPHGGVRTVVLRFRKHALCLAGCAGLIDCSPSPASSTELELHIAAPEGMTGTVVVDLGILEL